MSTYFPLMYTAQIEGLDGKRIIGTYGKNSIDCTGESFLLKNLPKGIHKVFVYKHGGFATKKAITWNIRTFGDKKYVPLTQTDGKKTKSRKVR